MTINNIDISMFGGTRLGYDISNQNLAVNFFDYDNTLQWYSTDVTAKKLVVSVYMEQQSREELMSSVSSLLREIRGESNITFSDNEHIFQCVFESMEKETIIPRVCVLKLSFKCIEMGEESEVTASALTTTITNIGTAKTPLTIEVLPSADVESLTIDDIMIQNLTANKEIIINGQNKTILEDGLLKAKDVMFYEFPYLNSGENIITVSDLTNVSITFRYNPYYL